MPERMRTIAQERRLLELMVELEKLEVDARLMRQQDELIPGAWRNLEKTAPTRPRRKKVTVALDEDVAKWFHALGAGYHRRINAVLRTYMLALTSKLLLGPGDRDKYGEPIWGKAAPKEKERPAGGGG